MDRTKAIPLKANLFFRPRISGLLDTALTNSLTTVIAGTGYGKTQAVADYVKSYPKPLVWLDLSERDNEAEHFWQSVCHAVERELPGVAQRLSGLQFPDKPEQMDAFAATLLEEHLYETELLLVVDHYNCIDEAAVSAFVESLIKQRAEHIKIILISNAKSDLNISKKLLGYGIYNIYSEDLCFTPQELTDYYQSLAIQITEDELQQVLERTEGWPLAVHLYALQYIQDTSRTFSSNSQFSHIFELFEHGYFSNYPKSWQKQLVLFSLLPSFSLDMLQDMTLDDAEAFGTQVLDNVFVTFDYGTHMLAFHNMYKEFLSLMQFMLNTEEINAMLQSAGRWLQEHRMYADAMDAFWRCQNYDEIVKTAFLVPAKRNDTWTTNNILYYLELLPKEYRDAHPAIDFSRAYLYLNRMDLEKSYMLFEATKAKLEETQEDPTLLGETYAALGDISLMRNTNDFALFYKKSSELLPNGSTYRNKELYSVYNNDVFFLTSEAPGELERIIRMMKATAPYCDHVLRGHGCGYELLFEAEGAYFAGQMARAADAALRGVQKAEENAQHDIALNGYFLLLRIAVFTGKWEEAQRVLKEISAYRELHAVLPELEQCFYDWYYITVGDLNKVGKNVAEFDQSKHELLPLNTGRNKTIHVMYLMQTEHWREALSQLTKMENDTIFYGLWGLRLRHSIMKAVANLHLHDHRSAVQDLRNAYQMTSQNGITTPFAEMGRDMVTLCEYAQASILYTFDNTWILQVKAGAEKHAKRLAVFRKAYENEQSSVPKNNLNLTKRERQVLQHLATGKTRKEIAELLNISANGVKNHITGIYNKLGAVNRADAVRLAIERGLIDAG